MTIRKSLKLMQELSEQNGLSKPYVVGGVPRNSILPGPFELSDVDITTGDEDVYKLATLFSKAIGKDLIQASDDHLLVVHNDVKYDFSKNFKYPNIDELLAEKGIKNPTDMQREAFSRDFTVNTIMFTPDFQKELDPTGRGIKDIKAMILECPVNCDISFQYDPKRILRAYYFRAKYGFAFSKNVADSISKNMSLLDNVNRRYSSEMINKILREEPEMLDELIEDGLIQHVPMTKYLTNLLIESRRLSEVMV